jgi:hypothetical protein
MNLAPSPARHEQRLRINLVRCGAFVGGISVMVIDLDPARSLKL